MQFDFSKKFSRKVLVDFSQIVQAMSATIGFKVSARGWCYLMEQAGYINKSQFDKVDSAINRCRKEGLLPVDFVAEEKAREFDNVETPDTESIEDTMKMVLRQVLEGANYYTPDWWDGEEYYIQMLVEKIDLLTLFKPICKQYHIPIANAKGWSSILQRAEYARRFKQAEERGLKCVLLYCGDHDPDGLRISDTIRKNLEQIQDIQWEDQFKGYNPRSLTIHRFGLNYDFIIENDYTWIDNLITGSGGELAKEDWEGNIVPGLTKEGKEHKNFNLPYLQQYIRDIGVRKCEANAIVTTPTIARDFVREEIENWVGPGARGRFAIKRARVASEYEELLEASGLLTPIRNIVGEDE